MWYYVPKYERGEEEGRPLVYLRLLALLDAPWMRDAPWLPSRPMKSVRASMMRHAPGSSTSRHGTYAWSRAIAAAGKETPCQGLSCSSHGTEI